MSELPRPDTNGRWVVGAPTWAGKVYSEESPAILTLVAQAWPVNGSEEDMARAIAALPDWISLCDRYREALELIAETPIPCLNPDGVDQAADQMKLIAHEALHPTPPGEGGNGSVLTPEETDD